MDINANAVYLALWGFCIITFIGSLAYHHYSVVAELVDTEVERSIAYETATRLAEQVAQLKQDAEWCKLSNTIGANTEASWQKYPDTEDDW